MARRTFYPIPIKVSLTVEVEIYPPKNGARSGLVIQNQDANGITFNEDVHADLDKGATQLGGLQTATYDDTTGIPQGKVYVKGTQAGLQSVLVKQAVDL